MGGRRWVRGRRRMGMRVDGISFYLQTRSALDLLPEVEYLECLTKFLVLTHSSFLRSSPPLDNPRAVPLQKGARNLPPAIYIVN